VCDPFASNRLWPGTGRQAAGSCPVAWTTWSSCGCDSRPSGVEVTAYPPRGRPDDRWCEAGIEGGKPALDRKLRRAQLEKDRNTNPRLNRRHVCAGLFEFKGPFPKWDRIESQARTAFAWDTLEPIPADRGILHPTTNEDQERSNPFEARAAPPRADSQSQALKWEGLPQKQMPLGKPGDTLTEARQRGR